MKRFYSILSVILAGPSFAQSFDVDQTSQFLRPRLRFDGRYCSTFNNGKNSLHFYDAQSLVTVPFHTRLKSSFGNLLIDGIHIETIKETKILFSQQMVSARVGYKNLFFDTTTSHVRDVYAGSLGLFGLQSLKKLNILFYSVNVNFAESSASLQHMRPGFSALVGDVKIKGLKKYYVYGVFTGYLGQRFVAVPFFGANLPIVKHHYLNFVLPVYAG
ncbi:MAG TPA: hypothetical protein VD905_05505, partial [Flavobacteriales bacterium]|nr:hypothetical protein [Flavobacteriales bacterium]